jgi:hypothetical protein
MIEFGARPLTSAAILAGLSGQNIGANSFTGNAGGYIGLSGRFFLRSTLDGEVSIRNAAETIAANFVVEANHTLAMRNGVSAQALRLYNTYTDASNYERAHLAWSGNVFIIDSQQSAGTGLSRALHVQAGGTVIGLEGIYTPGNGPSAPVSVRRDGTSAQAQFGVYGNGLTSTTLLHTRLAPSINQASGTYTILDLNPTETAVGAGPHYYIRGRRGAGADDFSVQRNGDVLCGALTIGGNVFTMTERTDPGVAGTNQGRVYLRDNGSGKTQLVVIFQSGSPIVLATEV